LPVTHQQDNQPSFAAHNILQYFPDIPDAMRDQFLSTISSNPNFLYNIETQQNISCPNKIITEALQVQGKHNATTHHTFQVSDSDMGNTNPGLSRQPTVTYEVKQCTTSWHSYKKQRMIDGNIHVLIAPTSPTYNKNRNL
jgi:hypothetical protein